MLPHLSSCMGMSLTQKVQDHDQLILQERERLQQQMSPENNGADGSLALRVEAATGWSMCDRTGFVGVAGLVSWRNQQYDCHQTATHDTVQNGLKKVVTGLAAKQTKALSSSSSTFLHHT